MPYTATITRLDNCFTLRLGTMGRAQVFPDYHPDMAAPDAIINTLCKELNRVDRDIVGDAPEITESDEFASVVSCGRYEEINVTLDQGTYEMFGSAAATVAGTPDLHEAYTTIDAVRRRLGVLLSGPDEEERNTVDINVAGTDGCTMRISGAQGAILVVRDKLGALSMFDMGTVVSDRSLVHVANACRELING